MVTHKEQGDNSSLTSMWLKNNISNRIKINERKSCVKAKMYFSTTDYFIRYSVWFLFAFGLVMFDRLSEALKK